MIRPSIFLGITAIVLFLFSCKGYTEANEVYTDVLLYHKSDSSLFTGEIREYWDNGQLKIKMNFCKGLPCGDWVEYDRGGSLVHKGRVIDQPFDVSFLKKTLGREEVYYCVDQFVEVTTRIITLEIYGDYPAYQVKEKDAKVMLESILAQMDEPKADFFSVSITTSVYGSPLTNLFDFEPEELEF